jgi:hypothetical protein
VSHYYRYVSRPGSPWRSRAATSLNPTSVISFVVVAEPRRGGIQHLPGNADAAVVGHAGGHLDGRGHGAGRCKDHHIFSRSLLPHDGIQPGTDPAAKGPPRFNPRRVVRIGYPPLDDTGKDVLKLFRVLLQAGFIQFKFRVVMNYGGVIMLPDARRVVLIQIGGFDRCGQRASLSAKTSAIDWNVCFWRIKAPV